MADRTKGRRLGRGLSSLIDSPRPVEVQAQPRPDGADSAQETAASPDRGLLNLQVDKIVPNKYQPRSEFGQEGLESLAASIRSAGVMQPVVVRRSGERWELVAGERRWRAAQLAGLATIPAVSVEVDDRQAAEWAIVENVQREDLNPIERGRGFARLAGEFGMSHAEIGEGVGIDRSTVANLIRILDLEEELRDLVSRGGLSAGHAKALLSAPAGPERVALGKRASGEGWSVRKLESAAKELNAPGAAGQKPAAEAIAPAAGEASRRQATMQSIEKRLGEQLGTRVRLKLRSSGTRGWIHVEFYDLDHFEGLMQRLGAELE